MRYSKLRKALCLLLVMAMILGLGGTAFAYRTTAQELAVNESQPGDQFGEPSRGNGVAMGGHALDEDILNAIPINDAWVSDNELTPAQVEAWRAISRENRSGGLVGFDGEYALEGSGKVSVIVELVNQPAAVARAAQIMNGEPVRRTTALDMMAQINRAEFRQRMNEVISTAASRTAAKPYTITAEYTEAINGMAVTLPADQVAELAALDCVFAVYPDVAFTASTTTSAYGDASGMETERAFLNIDALHAAGITGVGITVGVIDSGVDYNHPDLTDAFGKTIKEGSDMQPGSNGKYYGRNYVDQPFLPARGAYDPMETTYDEWIYADTKNPGTYPEITETGETFYTSHGTHVSGTVAARGTNSARSALGMAPGATLLVYRALGPYGRGDGKGVLSAIDDVYRDGCQVVNMSLGAPANNPYYITSVAINNIMFTHSDIVFAVSAGNSGPLMSTIGAPGTSTLAITVGNGTVHKMNYDVKAQAGSASATLRLMFSDKNSVFEENSVKLGDNAVGTQFDLVGIRASGSDDLGQGTKDEFKAAGNITGKIAVVARGQYFNLTSMYAKLAGAAGVIVVDYEKGGIWYSFTAQGSEYAPLFLVSYAEGMALLGSGSKLGLTSTVISDAPINDSSSRGPVGISYDIKPDIIAPGTDVLSTVPYYMTMKKPDAGDPGRYDNAYLAYSGTSMSSPHIAGIAALMLQNSPDMPSYELKARMMNTANPIDGFGVYEIGAGYINPAAAMEADYYALSAQMGAIGNAGGSSTEYEMKPVKTGALNFGVVYSSTPDTIDELRDTYREISREITLYNTTGTEVTLTAGVQYNTEGQLVRDSVGAGITLAYDSSVTIPANATATTKVTMKVPAWLGVENAGSYEGYLSYQSGSNVVIRMPFALFLAATVEGDALSGLALNKPVIAGQGAENRHLSASSTSDLYFTIKRDIAYVMPLVIDPYDHSKVLGWLGAYVDMTGYWDYAEYSGTYGFVIAEFIGNNYYYPVAPDGETFLDTPVYFEPGLACLGLLVRLPDGRAQEYPVEFYVDNAAPKLTVDNVVNGTISYGGAISDFTVTGKVFDEGLADMQALGMRYDMHTDGVIDQSLNAVVVGVGDAYYYADVTSDGKFSVDITGLDPFAPSEPMTFYAMDFYTLRAIFGYDDKSMVRGFDPDHPSYQINNGTHGYYGVNKTVTTVNAEYTAPYLKLSDSFKKLYPGEQLAIIAHRNAVAEAAGSIVGWSSSNPDAATVDGNGVVTAVSEGTAVITVTTTDGLSASCEIMVKARYNEGVHIPEGSAVYYGTYDHLTKADHIPLKEGGTSYGYDDLAYAGAEMPIIWTMVGTGADTLSLLSKYVLDVKPFYPGVGFYSNLKMKLWSNSYMRAWLNGYAFTGKAGVSSFDRAAGNAGSFLDSFSAAELGSIPVTEDITVINPAPYEEVAEITSDRVFLADTYSWSDSTVTWSADHREGSIIDDNRGSLRGGNDGRGVYYWLRSPYGGFEPMIGDDPQYVMYTGALPQVGDGPVTSAYLIYRTFAVMHFGVRPAMTLDADHILYAEKKQGGNPQAPYNEDGYKLTVLGGNGGADVGMLNVTGENRTVATGSDLVLPYVASSKYGADGQSVYKIAYKITQDDKIMEYGEFDTQELARNISLATAGLTDGKYTVYLWLVKKNAISSNEAGVVTIFTLSVEDEPVTGIELSHTSIALAMDAVSEYQLSAYVQPEHASNKTVVWSSSDEAVATVDDNGLVTRVGPGTAVIAAQAGDVSAECTVTVYETAENKVTDISAPLMITLTVGQVQKIAPVLVLPENATIPNLAWTSADADTVTVDNGGTLTALKVGSTTLKAAAIDGSEVVAGAVPPITVMVITAPSVNVSEVTLNHTAYELQVGQTVQLTATVLPENADNKAIKWTTSDDQTVSVDPLGRMTGLKKTAGDTTVTIRAIAVDTGAVAATCTVTVVEVPIEKITITADRDTVYIGETVKLTVTVEPANATNKALWIMRDAISSTVLPVPQDWSYTTDNVAVSTFEVKTGSFGASAQRPGTLAFRVMPQAVQTAPEIEYILPVITVLDAQGPTVPKTTFDFDKARYTANNKDIIIPFDLGRGVAAASGIAMVRSNQNGELKLGTDYALDGNNIIIFKQYLEKFSASTQPQRFIIRFTDSAGTMAMVEIYVSESDSVPVISYPMHAYYISAPHDVVLDVYPGSGGWKLTPDYITKITYGGDETLLDAGMYSFDPQTNQLTIANEFLAGYLAEHGADKPLVLGIVLTYYTRSGPNGKAQQVTIEFKDTAPVALRGLRLPESVTIAEQLSMKLVPTLMPANATNVSYAWTSGDMFILGVLNDGVIHANAVGTTTVTVTAPGGISAKTIVTIIPRVPATGVAISADELTLYQGTQWPLTAEVLPAEATNKNVTWRSSDETVATVDADGRVTAIGEGTASITATAVDRGADDAQTIVAACEVTVLPRIPATGVTISASERRLYVGDRFSLTASVQPAEATIKDITWSSSNEKVATVDNNGKVTAVGRGTASITATAADRGADNLQTFAAVCTITVAVRPKINTHTLTVRYIDKDTGNPLAPNYTRTLDSGVSYDVTEFTTITVKGYEVSAVAGETTGIIYSDVTVTVYYTATGKGGDLPAVIDNFTDVPEGAWYRDAVKFAAGRGLLKGYDEKTFGPEDNMTRAQFVTALGRLAEILGFETEGFACDFDDVVSGEWYEKYVAWGFVNGIIKGYGDETFGPEDKITREQMAVILIRFAEFAGIKLADDTAIAYDDAASVSTWARQAVNAATAAGLLQGSGGRFHPANYSMRCEVAQVLMNFITRYVDGAPLLHGNGGAADHDLPVDTQPIEEPK